MRVSLGVLLLGALAFGDEPLPVGRSATLSAGTYVLAGNEHLPKGVRLICKPGVRIIGKGKGKLLMIEGAFETQGVKGAEVLFENVWLQPYHTFQRIRLSFARFKGKGGLYTPTDREARGKLHLEDVWFQDEACIWVKFHMGKIVAKRVSSADSCRIEGTHSDRNLSVDISECFHETDLVSGFHGGLSVYNVKDVQIRSTRFGGSGATSRFHNCTRLLLEGCKFDSRALLVRHHKRARFKKTKILKCDFLQQVPALRVAQRRQGPRDPRQLLF